MEDDAGRLTARRPFAVELGERVPEAYDLLSALELAVRADEARVRAVRRLVKTRAPELLARFDREVRRFRSRAELLSEAEQERWRRAYIAEAVHVLREHHADPRSGARARSSRRPRSRSCSTGAAARDGPDEPEPEPPLAEPGPAGPVRVDRVAA
jgi:hypothetical protein